MLTGLSNGRDFCSIDIVHSGIGTFHRTYQASYADDVMA